uniref:Uncharacterized protein n=1 Tax=Rhizophora mucronata TaxID=61149 RepID=A0A2P2QVU7_RHIMU
MYNINDISFAFFKKKNIDFILWHSC